MGERVRPNLSGANNFAMEAASRVSWRSGAAIARRWAIWASRRGGDKIISRVKSYWMISTFMAQNTRERETVGDWLT
jgi:hypothetical protein